MHTEKEEVRTTKEISTQEPSFLEYLDNLKELLVFNSTEEGRVGDRMLSLSGGKVCFAIIVAELADSFIVSDPVFVLTNKDNTEMRVKPLGVVGVTRMFKHLIESISPTPIGYKCMYYKYLLNTKTLSRVIVSPSIIKGMLDTISEYTSTSSNINNKPNNVDNQIVDVPPISHYSNNKTKH